MGDIIRTSMDESARVQTLFACAYAIYSRIRSFYGIRNKILGEQIETLYNFSKDAGLRFIYDLNLMLRIGSTLVDNFHNTTWNSTNAQQIINYTTSRGFDMDWELGNGTLS